MKKYKVTVNGTAYEIELEEISASEVKATPTPVAVATPAPASQAVDGEKICAPMPGNILDVKVKVGDSVKSGDVLLILEAMKMENEIMASKDGVVKSVEVAKGASVETGALLCVIG